MPQIITTDMTSTGATILTTIDDDAFFIADGVVVSTTSPSSPAYPTIYVLHNDIRIGVAGTVFATASSAMYSYGLNTSISVAGTGSMMSLGQSWDCIIFTTSGGQIINAGEISSQAGAVTSWNGTAKVFNSGLIAGVTHGVSGATLVENSGTIRGATSVAMSGGNDMLINTGTLIGNVNLGDGSDIFDTIGGVVRGQIIDGGGDDVYRTDSALLAIIEDVVGGMDRVESTVDFDLNTTANIENLTLLGSAATGSGNVLDNSMTGNLIANRLSGGFGNDTIGAAGGNDTLRGGGGNDSLYGQDGDDTLWGDAAADRLFGDEGEDVLIGGAGRDTLDGGTEADTFQFRLVSDSRATAATRDVIVQFETGVDLIDLTRLDANSLTNGNQAFVFIGAAAFGNVAGQLRVIGGANSVLQADVNGDGVADFEVQLNAIAAVNVNDILL